jgi:ketosteroid isomerase-like protein
MRADPATVSLLTRYYDAIEANRPEDYSAFYTEDMTLTFGNNPQVTGRAAAVEAFGGILDQVHSLHHDLVNVWEEDDGTVIFETVGTWTLFDGTAIPVNAVGVFTVVDGLIVDQRITVDNGPVFAALETAA